MERHAETSELLALRDGDGAAWTKAHVAACMACSAELFRLEQVRAQLKALPALTAPRDRWLAVRSGALADRRSRRLRAASFIAAAAVLTAITFAALRPRDNSAAERAALDRAMARSQALEQTLRALRPEDRALKADAAAAVAALQDQLSGIDAALADPGAQDQPRRQVELWQQRAGVLSALVDVHVTRVAQAGL